MQTDQLPFLKRLAAIAKLVDFKLDDDVLELYDRALSPLGYGKLVAAIDRLALELGPGSTFPSIRAIHEAVTGQRRPETPTLAQDSQDAARVAAGLVIEAVGKFGAIVGDGPNSRAKLERLKAHVGELGWEAVKAFGSWNTLCDMLTYENMGTVSAQIREYARALLDRKSRGQGDLPPGLGETPVQPRIGGLTPISAIDTANAVADLIQPKPRT